MSVTVAKTAGFCFGVRRAVDLAEQQAKKNGKIYAYGEIIHNMHEIERLEKLGVHTAYALEDIPDGAGVLIRAHGVPRNVYTLLQAKSAKYLMQPALLCGKYTKSRIKRARTDG